MKLGLLLEVHGSSGKNTMYATMQPYDFMCSLAFYYNLCKSNLSDAFQSNILITYSFQNWNKYL